MLRLSLLAFAIAIPPLLSAQGDPTYFLNGSAGVTGEDCYQLTPAINTQTGSVWYADQVDLSLPLDLQFLLNLGTNDSGGADGICFVLQTVGTNALGESGGGLGFLGADFQPAFAVEFDTWQNGDYGDPAGDHIAMVSNGSVDHNAATAIAGPVQADAFDANIEDGEDHLGRITWDPAEQVVRVYFDCELRLEGIVDLIGDIFNGENQVYFGFTSSTGGANNLQTVCLEDNILGSAEQSFVCPGAELQLNVSSPSGTANWTPGLYLDDSLSSSPVVTPPDGLTDPLVYVASYADNCGVDVIDTIQLNVEVMTVNVLGVDNLTCLNDEVNLSSSSNFPGPFSHGWTAQVGAIQAVGSQASVNVPGSYSLLLSFQDGLCEAQASFDIALDTATFTGVFPAAGYLTCADPTFPLESESLSNPSASVSWSTTNGNFTGSGPSVTATETGTYTASVTNPVNGCVSVAEVDVIAANQAPILNGGSVEPLTCLNPGQPVEGASVQEYARAGRPHPHRIVDQCGQRHHHGRLSLKRVVGADHQCRRHLSAGGGMGGNRLRRQRPDHRGGRGRLRGRHQFDHLPQHPDRQRRRQERQLVSLPRRHARGRSPWRAHELRAADLQPMGTIDVLQCRRRLCFRYAHPVVRQWQWREHPVQRRLLLRGGLHLHVWQQPGRHGPRRIAAHPGMKKAALADGLPL